MSTTRLDIYARFLSTARAFPTPVHDLPALSAGLASLHETATYAELIAPWLDGAREGLLEAAERVERLIAQGQGAGSAVVKEAIGEYNAKLIELRDMLRIATVEMPEKIDRATTPES